MSATLEDLERRLATVERELAELRLRAAPPLPPPPGVDPEVEATIQRVPMLRQARANAHLWAAAADELRRKLGITEEPIGAEEVQKLMMSEGMDPSKNELSRGIIEMREE